MSALDIKMVYFVLGDRFTGKSNLLHKHFDGKFIEERDQEEEMRIRQKIDWREHATVTEICNEKHYNKYLGEYNFKFNEPSISAFILCYDVSNPESLGVVRIYLENLKQRPERKYIVANKIDLEDKCKNQGKALAMEYGVVHLECSAKENLGVEELFKILETDAVQENSNFAKRQNLLTWRSELPHLKLEIDSISVLIYGHDEQSAYDLANLFGQKVEGKNVWMTTENGRDIFFYPRWPLCAPIEYPLSPILAIYSIYDVTSDDQVNERTYEISNFIKLGEQLLPSYVFHRNSSPSELNVNHLEYNLISEKRNFIIQKLTDYEKALKNIFDSFDVNQNGFFTAADLFKSLEKMGRDIEMGEAEWYHKEITGNEKVSFSEFKNWYVSQDQKQAAKLFYTVRNLLEKLF